MPVPESTGPVWRTSSRSGQDNNCVQVAGTLRAVRDSKNPAGPVLAVDLGPLVAGLKTGHLHR